MVATRLLVLFAIIGLACAESAEDTEDRVVRGRNAPLGAFKFAVSLQLHWRNQPRKMQFCGGSLIRDRVVLTAAHCVMDPPPGADIVAVMGATQSNCGNARNAQIIPLLYQIKHPQYDPNSLENDIAVVILQHPAQITATVAPIRLGSIADIQGRTEATILGWGGRNNIEMNSPTYPMQCVDLQMGTVGLLHKSECENVFREMQGFSATPSADEAPQTTVIMKDGLPVPSVQRDDDEHHEESVSSTTEKSAEDAAFEEEIKTIPNVGFPVLPLNLLRSTHSGQYNPMNLHPRKQICVGSARGQTLMSHTCKGDSGGPLMGNALNGEQVLFGVTSFGHPGKCAEHPGVYTLLFEYLRFINSAMQMYGGL